MFVDIGQFLNSGLWPLYYYLLGVLAGWVTHAVWRKRQTNRPKQVADIQFVRLAAAFNAAHHLAKDEGLEDELKERVMSEWDKLDQAIKLAEVDPIGARKLLNDDDGSN